MVHNISLPPGEFGGPWIDALFTGTIDPDAHPFFVRNRSSSCFGPLSDSSRR
ncbi:N-acetyl-anhydromuranmyl-L-alanine amidase [Salmonella enterica subsp. enterica serovar Heidelberg str. RI-11-014316]|nr:N-acetyl-anhydromuranmyl-L-alanine amidase [Salmonella enterica subsp. enterica serovar Heidelberg str. RI-11-014316]